MASFPRWKQMGARKMPLLGKILRPISTLYTEWTDFGPRSPQKLNHEQQICVLKGSEKFRLVSPIYRQNIYVGEVEELEADQSPVDFFDPDFEQFPFAKNAQFIEVVLEAGDCMYVPAYYYVQS